MREWPDVVDYVQEVDGGDGNDDADDDDDVDDKRRDVDIDVRKQSKSPPTHSTKHKHIV